MIPIEKMMNITTAITPVEKEGQKKAITTESHVIRRKNLKETSKVTQDKEPNKTNKQATNSATCPEINTG